MRFKFLVLVPILFFVVACGDDDCTQEDWAGTYTLVENSCEDATGVTLDSTLVLTVGGAEDEIILTGSTVIIDNCTAMDTIFGLEMELDGDELSFELLGCSAVYERN